MSKIILAHLALLALNLIYGSSHFIAKEVMPEYLAPNFFIFIRVIGATTLFWIIRLVIREKIQKKDLFRLALCGLFGVAINQLLFFQGLSRTSPVDSAVIMVSTPVLVTIFSFIILKTKLTTNKVLGVLIGLCGASYLIYLGSGNSTEESGLLGNFLIFLNATSYGIYIVIIKPLMAKYKPITVITLVFSFGFLYVLPFGLYELKDVSLNFPINIWLAIGFIVLFTTFATYLLNAFALSHLQPTVTSSYMYLQPVFAMLTGVVMSLADPTNNASAQITAPKILATLTIFVGVYLIGKSSFTKPTKINSVS